MIAICKWLEDYLSVLRFWELPYFALELTKLIPFSVKYYALEPIFALQL